jgi:small-conductance mechanosensitive channel/CRP-like cAMP-binding protein
MSLSGMFRGDMASAVLASLALALILLALRPRERASTRNMLVLLGFACIAELAGHLIAARQSPTVGTAISDAASIAVGLVVIRLAATALFRVLLPALRLQTARIIEDLVVTALFAAWGLLWLRMAGVDFASLVTTSAVITAVLAFSMKDTLGNVLGGVVLQLDQSVRVGDWVKIDDVSGRIVEIGWRHTAVETRNRETVVIPNGLLMTNKFMVIGSRADPRPLWRRWVRVNVDLTASPSAVCAALERAVRDADIANVAADPPATAVLMEIGPRYGTYALRYFLSDPLVDDPTDSAVRSHILASLARKGMKLGVPYQEELSIRESSATQRAAVAARDLDRRRSALAGAELFSTLSASERDALAEQLVHAPFAKGDTITRQGDVAHWLYLIASGRAEVVVITPSGKQPIATLLAGSVFGEMGMMTGEPRKASVIARGDTECYRLDKAGFEAVLKSRPDIAEEISRILASREAELFSAIDSGAGARQRASRQDDILRNIRNFFGLDE